MLLRQHRRTGIRVVAVSDTGLSTKRLVELIDHFHGPGLLDRVYSSADFGASKRYGSLFRAVLEAESVSPDRVLHIGDDPHADFRVPDAMGLKTVYLPRGRARRWISRADGAAMEAGRWVHRRLADDGGPPPMPHEAAAVGREVFGPIVAQFCLAIWLYARQAEATGDAALLFCARGGVGIREAFERLLSRLHLPLDLPRENLLISRLVAARTAIATRNTAVLDELGREFRGARFVDVARALGGRDYGMPEEWNRAFDPAGLFHMLDSDAGRALRDDIAEQNALFTRHLDRASGGARRVILCDTGLYGSTQRLLAAGFPSRELETVQFARSNYKGLSEDHFPRVVGLIVEQKCYNPFKAETVVLRYWQIIESLFEPAVPSVRHLSETADAEVVANSGDLRYGRLDPSVDNALLSGALDYIDGLTRGAQVFHDADHAWSLLKKAITAPTRFDIGTLGVGPRSVDFGRAEEVPVIGSARRTSTIARLKDVKTNLWREGAIARDFPLAKPVLLTLLEGVHILRGISSRLNLGQHSRNSS